MLDGNDGVGWLLVLIVDGTDFVFSTATRILSSAVRHYRVGRGTFVMKGLITQLPGSDSAMYALEGVWLLEHSGI